SQAIPSSRLPLSTSTFLQHGLWDVQGLQLIQAPLRLDEGRVAAEQELILEPALHVAYDLGRDVARRRPGDVDGDVGLVQGHREQLQVPRVAEMRGDDFEVGKGGRRRIEPDRSREVDPDPLAARLAGTDSACSGVK